MLYVFCFKYLLGTQIIYYHMNKCYLILKIIKWHYMYTRLRVLKTKYIHFLYIQIILSSFSKPTNMTINMFEKMLKMYRSDLELHPNMPGKMLSTQIYVRNFYSASHFHQLDTKFNKIFYNNLKYERKSRLLKWWTCHHKQGHIHTKLSLNVPWFDFSSNKKWCGLSLSSQK